MENNLSILENKELRIKSVELVDVINKFRCLEHGKSELKHDNLMKKIRKEVETLQELGLDSDVNFYVAKYLDEQGKERPCYELNRDGMLQMLNSESALVRYKTIEYINKLETKLNNTQLLLAAQKIQELQNSFEEFKKSLEDAKHQFKLSHKRKLGYNRLIKSLSLDREDEEDIKGFVFTLLNIEKWEDACTDDHEKIIETIRVGARLFSLKKFEQISLF